MTVFNGIGLIKERFTKPWSQVHNQGGRRRIMWDIGTNSVCLIGFEIMVEDVSMDKYSVDPCYSGADDSAPTSCIKHFRQLKTPPRFRSLVNPSQCIRSFSGQWQGFTELAWTGGAWRKQTRLQRKIIDYSIDEKPKRSSSVGKTFSIVSQPFDYYLFML